MFIEANQVITKPRAPYRVPGPDAMIGRSRPVGPGPGHEPVRGEAVLTDINAKQRKCEAMNHGSL
jgi:hypothetical protein